jgi:hypothetical protein
LSPVPCTILQVTEYEYDLVLQPDINTRGHTQWFFFAVANTRAGVPYRLNIINLLKEDSLYNMGMLPLMHSEQQMRSKVCARTGGWGPCLGFLCLPMFQHLRQMCRCLTHIRGEAMQTGRPGRPLGAACACHTF